MNDIEEYLSSLKWQDISILMNAENQPILILLCPDGNEAEKMLHLLKNNPFRLEVAVNQNDGSHNLRIELTNTEYGIGLKSPLTLESYPPLNLLHNKQVLGITCGFNNDGQILYNPAVHPIDGNQVILN